MKIARGILPLFFPREIESWKNIGKRNDTKGKRKITKRKKVIKKNAIMKKMCGEDKGEVKL